VAVYVRPSAMVILDKTLANQYHQQTFAKYAILQRAISVHPHRTPICRRVRVSLGRDHRGCFGPLLRARGPIRQSMAYPKFGTVDNWAHGCADPTIETARQCRSLVGFCFIAAPYDSSSGANVFYLAFVHCNLSFAGRFSGHV